MSEPVDIFVSYAREDEDRAGKLVRALEACGWRVFWDRTIPPGETWRSHIGVPLDQAKVVLVVWSQHSIEADFVHAEANRAKSRGALVPVLVDDVTPPMGFEHIQAADLMRWMALPAADLPDILLRTLERRLAEFARVTQQPTPRPAAAPAPARTGTPPSTVASNRVSLSPMLAGGISGLLLVVGLIVGLQLHGSSDADGAAQESAVLREQNRQLQARLHDAEAARSRAEEAAGTALEKASQSERRAGDLTRQLDTMKNRLQATESELRKASSRVDAAEASVVSLRREIDELKSARQSRGTPPAQAAMPSDGTSCKVAIEVCIVWPPMPIGAACECKQVGGAALKGTIVVD